MRKTLLIVMVLALVLTMLSAPAKAQQNGITQVAVGSLLERGGKSSLALFAGGNPFVFYKDTVKGVYWYNRDGYFYSSRLGGDSSDVQAGVAWVLISKEFTLPNSKIDFNFTIGSGVLHQFKDSSDITTIGGKIEGGLTIWKTLSAAVGVDYFPRRGIGDVAFVYGLIAIKP